jgi:ubiquitin C-terminal hydrolase
MEYELIGFIKHYGSAEDGHNVAFTKNIFDQKWYLFNDSKVESINGIPKTDKAFLLFYQIIH